MKGVGWFPRHPDQSACVKGENDKQTNESGGSTGKQSGEVRGKEGEGKGKPLSLSLPPFSPSFSFTPSFKRTESYGLFQRNPSSSLPAFLFQSRSGKGEGRGGLVCTGLALHRLQTLWGEDRICDLMEIAHTGIKRVTPFLPFYHLLSAFFLILLVDSLSTPSSPFPVFLGKGRFVSPFRTMGRRLHVQFFSDPRLKRFNL